MAKRLDSHYEHGQRSGASRKMRINVGQEFVIRGYSIGSSHFDSISFGYYEGDQLMYAGRTRNGLLRSLGSNLHGSFTGLRSSSVRS